MSTFSIKEEEEGDEEMDPSCTISKTPQNVLEVFLINLKRLFLSFLDRDPAVLTKLLGGPLKPEKFFVERCF